MAIPDNVRIPIIVGAAAAAGDPSSPGYRARLEAAAIQIMLAAEPESPLSKRLAGVSDAKKFVGVLKSVEIEQPSTRGLLTIQGNPSQYHEDGIEQARTERTDGEFGAAMVDRLKTMIGHRVLFFVELQQFGNGAEARKLRVIVHAEDLGEPREFTPQNNQGAQQYTQAPPNQQQHMQYQTTPQGGWSNQPVPSQTPPPANPVTGTWGQQQAPQQPAPPAAGGWNTDAPPF